MPGGFANGASLNGDKPATLTGPQALASQHGRTWAGLGLLPARR